MSYELFLQGPEVYIPILLLLLAVTMTAYGAFPIIFAKARKSSITKKKYRWLCYGINLAVMLGFTILGGGSLRPYLFWTWLFTKRGINILRSEGVLEDNENNYDTSDSEGEPESSIIKMNKNNFCRKCGDKLLENSKFCRKCGAQVEEL